MVRDGGVHKAVHWLRYPMWMPSASSARATSVRTVSAGLRGHDNALGFIRLVLAFAVLVSHTFPLGGFGHDPGGTLSRGQATLGSLAVAGFFGISGYLITKSGMSADIMQFLWRRFLRIFPAFLVVLLASAFILGPLIWKLDGHSFWAYFDESQGDGPWNYVFANWTLKVGAWSAHEVFGATTPYGATVGRGVINGSMWTLTHEWTCYLVVGALLVTGILKRARVLVVAMTAVIFAGQIALLTIPGEMSSLFDPLGLQLIALAYPFAIGAIFAVYSRSIPLNAVLGAISGVLLFGSLLLGGYALIGVPAGVYFALWLGSALPGALRKVGQKNDYSYGVYLLAFPAQQVLAYAGLYKLGIVPMMVGAAIVVAGLSWLSWHFVEKRALALKDWGPGEGIAVWWARLRSLVSQGSLRPLGSHRTEGSPRSQGPLRASGPLRSPEAVPVADEV